MRKAPQIIPNHSGFGWSNTWETPPGFLDQQIQNHVVAVVVAATASSSGGGGGGGGGIYMMRTEAAVDTVSKCACATNRYERFMAGAWDTKGTHKDCHFQHFTRPCVGVMYGWAKRAYFSKQRNIMLQCSTSNLVLPSSDPYSKQ